VSEDESLQKIKMDKIPSLKPAFKKDGTVTAANASSLNDGASALVIASEEFAKKHDLKPLATIIGYADAARESVDFTTAPSLAVPKALKVAGISSGDVDYHEVNEAFAVVALANAKVFDII
jgi:acetyl-CoA C-acetyltransferase